MALRLSWKKDSWSLHNHEARAGGVELLKRGIDAPIRGEEASRRRRNREAIEADMRDKLLARRGRLIGAEVRLTREVCSPKEIEPVGPFRYSEIVTPSS